jgi:hypothetical protein
MMSVFSTPEQLRTMENILRRYVCLPISTDVIPGAFLEAVLAHARSAERLYTYDYVDVIDRAKRVGWSIKSTKWDTPLTWKRAKIPSQLDLIAQSKDSASGCQNLGDALVRFCNEHAHASLARYSLDEIGYARLILFKDGSVRYFERKLCDRTQPDIFDPNDFEWRWSIQKEGRKKEQLPALHGIHRTSGARWWAWHGLGENQLHFTGERNWWPAPDSPHAMSFSLPDDCDRISFDRLLELLEDW